jgi:hypothetical protein
MAARGAPPIIQFNPTKKLMPVALHPESASGRMAVYLAKHKQAIIDTWQNYVRNDPAIKSPVAFSVLKGQIPKLLDDIVAAIASHQGEETLATIRHDAVDHAKVRWMDGYELPDLLREIGHLRTAFLYDLRMFEETNPDFGVAARLFLSVTLHRLLTEIAVQGAEHFLGMRACP